MEVPSLMVMQDTTMLQSSAAKFEAGDDVRTTVEKPSDQNLAVRI